MVLKKYPLFFNFFVYCLKLKAMKKIIYLLFITFLLSSCGTKKSVVNNNTTNSINLKNVTFSGGNGSSYEKAVIIKAKNSRVGISAEYKYLEQKYGKRGIDWQFIQQALSYKNKKPFDVLTIKYKEKEFSVYFEISSFFGKY